MPNGPFHNEHLLAQALQRETKRAFPGEDPKATIAAVERQYEDLMSGRKVVKEPMRELRAPHNDL